MKTEAYGGLWFQRAWKDQQVKVLDPGDHHIEIKYELYSSVAGEVVVTVGECVDSSEHA